MSDLKTELASLRIDRESKPRSGWRWLALVGILVILAVVAGFYFIPVSGLTATEVETVRPTVLTLSQAAAGSPILTASGYVVARRKAVVSAKIQGRLAQLSVEEGSHVREGDVIARLESADYKRKSKSPARKCNARRPTWRSNSGSCASRKVWRRRMWFR